MQAKISKTVPSTASIASDSTYTSNSAQDTNGMSRTPLAALYILFLTPEARTLPTPPTRAKTQEVLLRL